jgi:predicted transcriptional regulator
MSGRTSLELKKEILLILKDGKPHSYAELEKKVNSNWQTIRTHCKELQIFKCVKVALKQHHSKNNKPYFEVSITKEGNEILKRI